MKIIKYGNVPEHQCTCDVCGCEFIASFSEYTHTQFYDKKTERTLWETFESECPCCGNTVQN